MPSIASLLSSVGGSATTQSAPVSDLPGESTFAKSVASAELGQVTPPRTMHSASEVVRHFVFQQTLAKAMAEVAQARTEASEPD